MPVPDEVKSQLPVAFGVAKPGMAPSEEALRRFALDNGPAYAHPRAVWFVEEHGSPAPDEAWARRRPADQAIRG